MGLKADRIIFETRMAIADLFNLEHPERIIFTKNATEGLNLALKGILKRGDEVAISRLEHNSVVRPLASLKKAGVKIDHAACDKYGTPDVKKLTKVKMLASVAGSNVTGALADIDTLSARCRKSGTLFMVDAAQTAGSIPMDYSKVDILVCPGHKGLLGPQGTGFVWFAPTVDPEPLLAGGTGSRSESAAMPDFYPDRMEAGTMNTPGIAGLRAALKYLKRRTIEAIREHELNLCKMMLERLGNNPKIELYPPYDAERRASLVSFNATGTDPSELWTKLDRGGVISRVGLHCSPEAHKFMGTFPKGAVRVSPGPFTKKSEINYFLKAVEKAIG